MHELIKLAAKTRLTDREVIGDLFQAMDDGKDFVSGDNNYVWFYLIGQHYRPRVVVEMGTRFGYSIKAFLDGAGHVPEEYTIWTIDAESDGMKTLDIFEAYFRDRGVKEINIVRQDTRHISSLKARNADLCMVDGCHTFDGCYHECELAYGCLRDGGVMIVDDVNQDATLNACTKLGAEKFCADFGLSYDYLPSFRGIYVIVK